MTTFMGNRPLPNAVALLGYEVLGADPDAGTAEVSFVGRVEFTNLMGNVQGGFLAAMLDAAASSALLAQLPDEQAAPTIEMKVSFLRPAPVGRLIGRGRVVHRGKSIAFLEGALYDPDDVLLATATATARIVTM